MIPHTTLPLQASVSQTASWQEELSRAIRDPHELFQLLELDNSKLLSSLSAHKDFKLMAPRPYLAKIEKGNLNDPLLKQILPDAAELLKTVGYSNDPLDENHANPAPGLIHKYHGRVLLIVSPACAIHCRYCFRRHFPYQDNQPGRKHWRQALDYIAADPSISEVIFSGGDPLAANDHQLLWLTRQIAAIPHIKRLRVHTRFPVVIPSRINSDCIAWMTQTRLQTLVVLHINHPNELGEDTRKAVELLSQAGIKVLNQAVLLKDINDEPLTLIALSEKLYETGILPYYLHTLDTVQGAAHFAISRKQTLSLQRYLLTHLPGYLVPKFVTEEAGANAKVALGAPL